MDEEYSNRQRGFSLEHMETYRKETLNFKQLILNHLSNISFITSRVDWGFDSRDQAKALLLSVSSLEQFLTPYLDEQYIMEKGELVKANHSKETLKQFMKDKGKTVLMNWWGHADSSPWEMQRIQYALIHLSLVQNLLARKGLLLEKETRTIVKRAKDE